MTLLLAGLLSAAVLAQPRPQAIAPLTRPRLAPDAGTTGRTDDGVRRVVLSPGVMRPHVVPDAGMTGREEGGVGRVVLSPGVIRIPLTPDAGATGREDGAGGRVVLPPGVLRPPLIPGGGTAGREDGGVGRVVLPPGVLRPPLVLGTPADAGTSAPQPEPSEPSEPSGASAANAADAAREGLALYEENCPSDGYDEEGCERALALLEQAAAQDPSNADVELALGQATWNRAYRLPREDPRRTQLKERSVGIFQRLVTTRATDARPHFELSLRLKDAATRQRLLENAVRLDAKHAGAHRALADIYLDRGRVEEAVRIYQKGMDARRDVQDGLSHVRWAQRLTAAGRPAEAATVYQRVLESAEDEPRSRRCLLIQDVDVAPYRSLNKNFTNKVEALRPHCAGIERLQRAATLEHAGKLDDAIQELEQQVKGNDRHEESIRMLERLYLRKGKPEKAVDAARAFLRVEQDRAERCRHFRLLSPVARQQLDRETADRLSRECKQSP